MNQGVSIKVDKKQAIALYETATPDLQQRLTELLGKETFILDKRERGSTFADICREMKVNEADYALPESGTNAELAAAWDKRCELIGVFYNPAGWVPDMADTSMSKYCILFDVVKDASFPSGVRLSLGDFGYGRSRTGLGARHQFENSDDAVFCGKTFAYEYSMLANYLNLAKIDAIKSLTK